MMHVIVDEDLVDAAFIASRTIGYDELRANVADYSPEAMAPICGIDAETIRYVARLYATSRASMILWGMGISQHVHGTDNARCLIALSLMTGQIGRPGTGLHPLRGQNNVQGASDAGLIPMMFPDYQHVSSAAVRARFESAWGLAAGTLDERAGPDRGRGDERDQGRHACAACTSWARTRRCRTPTRTTRASRSPTLEHLVVQDIFFTETAYLADVILPASAFPEKTGTFTNTDRLVQMGRQAIDPPGDARQDLWIIQQIAKRMGLPWRDDPVSAVFDEMRQHHAEHRRHHLGAARARARRHLSVHEGRRPGPVGRLRRHRSRAKAARRSFVPADIIPADERPDAEYPMVLITGRQLEHWHTGSMTRRATALDALEPDPVALVHPLDLAALGGRPGDVVTIESRRGEVVLFARADESSPRGAVFVPFCYYEAAINRLTNAALDPFAKIPEFKYCAVRLSLGGTLAAQTSFGGGQVLAQVQAAGAAIHQRSLMVSQETSDFHRWCRRSRMAVSQPDPPGELHAAQHRSARPRQRLRGRAWRLQPGLQRARPRVVLGRRAPMKASRPAPATSTASRPTSRAISRTCSRPTTAASSPKPSRACGAA